MDYHNPGASKAFNMSHHLQGHQMFIERSKVIVLSGHMIPVSTESVMYLAKFAHEWGKDFFFNLSAVYVVQKYSSVISDLFQYIDFLFCSQSEAIAFATMKGYHTTDIKTVAKLLADEPKIQYSNPRIPNSYKSGRVVIITRKEKPVLMAKSLSKEVKEFPIRPIKDEQIKDTSGCGDALMGGFLAMYNDLRELDVCVNCGIYCAWECIQLPSCTLPKEYNFNV